MSFPDAAVRSMLDNLTQLLFYKADLAADVKGDIVELEKGLRTLKRLMKDVTEHNHRGIQIPEDVVNDIRIVSCEAEDAVDTYYLLQAAADPKSRKWASKALHQMANDPKRVFRDVAEHIREAGLKLMMIHRHTFPYVQEEIGFDQVPQYPATPILDRYRFTEEALEDDHDRTFFAEPADEVAELLTNGPENLEVIYILGMPGLGKTKLAKIAYNHPNVDYEYMIRAFVYVSQGYDEKKILLKILASFSQINEEVTNMGIRGLKEYIRKQLEGKKYMIALDDVWEFEDWDRLKDVFPNNNKRCRVMITTRHEEVAKYANPSNPKYVYRLFCLTLNESRELLRSRVFHKNHCPQKLQGVEGEIVKKCGGLPLAIVVMASIILNHPESIDWWKDVAKFVKHDIARDMSQTFEVVESMYNLLPNYLKPCFLYLGAFHEDLEIPVWKLVRLWISEGFIQQDGNSNLEDIAEKYLKELIRRNILMVGQRKVNGEIKTCRMHDTFCKFCREKAAKENLFQHIHEYNFRSFLSGDPRLDHHRRLCFHNVNVLDYISKTTSGNRVHSFIAFTEDKMTLEPEHVSSIPKTFKLLKVLEIQSLIFTRFPVDLCNLVLLKYISISTNFPTLPSSLSALWNLQTLIVSTTCRTLDIKADLWKMPHFRHLHTKVATTLVSPYSNSQKSKDYASPKSVQTLCTISTESCKKEIFYQTPNLRKLGICGRLTNLFKVNGESSLLPKLYELESLTLLNDGKSCKLPRLPSKSSFPPWLRKLTLVNTLLDWKEMHRLGELERLEVLKLKDDAFQGKLWQTEKGGFYSLKHLYIGQCDLVVWEASADDFPVLKSLHLNGCDKLQAIPHGLADISTLELVVLHCTNPQVASSARKLQILRLEQGRKGNKSPNSFKVSIYPPEH